MAQSHPIGLTGRHVVVTGGTGALGDVVVARFLREGAICHVPVREGPPPSASRRDGVRYGAGVDLTEESAVVAFYEGLPSPLWASVHLAGGFTMAPIGETSSAELRRQLELNVVTTFLCSREAVRAMRRGKPGPSVDPPAGEAGGGRIVQVAARSGLRPQANQLAYSLSKAAIVALTSGLAEELKREGILVNGVAPGTMNTPANRASMPALDPRDWVSPEDVAEVILWLASPSNRAGSGATVPIYGNS